MSLAATLQADGGRPASFLPSIKCSHCGDEIEIASMGEHICGKGPESQSAQQAHMSNPFALRQMNALGVQHQPTAPSPLRNNGHSGTNARVRATTLSANQQPLSPKPARVPPPRINPDAANRPFLAPKPPRSESPISPALSVSSGSGYGQPKLPPFARSLTSPMPRLYDPRPPSPELSANYDCAFPPFPSTTPGVGSAGNSRPSTSQGRKTPTPSERAPSRGSNRQDSRLGDREPFHFGPPSPKGNGNESVLKKMGTLKSGPFDGKRRKPSNGETPGVDDRNGFRRPSEPATRMSEDLPPRPSTSASNRSALVRKPSERNPPPTRPLRAEDDEVLSPTFLDQFSSEPMPHLPSIFSPSKPPVPLRSEDRSKTFPVQLPRDDDGARQPRERRPSEPALRGMRERRPTVTEGSSAAPMQFPPRSESRSGNRMDPRLQGAPPVPKPIEHYRHESLHTPSESGSSTVSSVGNSGSSVGPSPSSSAASSIDAFSPLTHEPGSYGEERGMRVAGLNVKNHQSPGDRAAEKSSPPSRSLTSASRSRPEPQMAADALPRPGMRPDRPMDSPTDPSLRSRNPAQQGQHHANGSPSGLSSTDFTPRPGILRTQTAPLNAPSAPFATQNMPMPPRPSDDFDPYRSASPQSRSRSKSNASQFSRPFSSNNPPRPPLPTSTSAPPPIPYSAPHMPPVRKNTIARPPCRGCGKIIEGKSVKAADGRLTGRWHKACFTCRTCQQPFATADFYVIDNHPYCEQHYHEKNNSLCHGCHRGIEGQYLETNGSNAAGGQERKFHPRCFTCQDCRQVLSDDYFEILGKVFCERHALAAMRGQARVAGPGGPLSGLNPAMNGNIRAERRTTKLMMM